MYTTDQKSKSLSGLNCDGAFILSSFTPLRHPSLSAQGAANIPPVNYLDLPCSNPAREALKHSSVHFCNPLKTRVCTGLHVNQNFFYNSPFPPLPPVETGHKHISLQKNTFIPPTMDKPSATSPFLRKYLQRTTPTTFHPLSPTPPIPRHLPHIDLFVIFPTPCLRCGNLLPSPHQGNENAHHATRDRLRHCSDFHDLRRRGCKRRQEGQAPSRRRFQVQRNGHRGRHQKG